MDFPNSPVTRGTMDDLALRLKKALAPNFPDTDVSQDVHYLADLYASAHALLQEKERLKCQAILSMLPTSPSGIVPSLQPSWSSEPALPLTPYWERYGIYGTKVLCKALLLSATFVHKFTAFEALETMHQFLIHLRSRVEKGPDGFEKSAHVADLNELWELKDEMENRLFREKDVEYVKETRVRIEQSTWEVRMTEDWLDQTASEQCVEVTAQTENVEKRMGDCSLI